MPLILQTKTDSPDTVLGQSIYMAKKYGYTDQTSQPEWTVFEGREMMKISFRKDAINTCIVYCRLYDPNEVQKAKPKRRPPKELHNYHLKAEIG